MKRKSFRMILLRGIDLLKISLVTSRWAQDVNRYLLDKYIINLNSLKVRSSSGNHWERIWFKRDLAGLPKSLKPTNTLSKDLINQECRRGRPSYKKVVAQAVCKHLKMISTQSSLKYRRLPRPSTLCKTSRTTSPAKRTSKYTNPIDLQTPKNLYLKKVKDSIGNKWSP